MRENRPSGLGGGRRSNPFSIHITRQLFLDTNPTGSAFNTNGLFLSVQSVSRPNAAGTANVVTPSNVARGAATALVNVVAPLGSSGQVLASVIQSIDIRGDGASITTSLPFSTTNSITSTGPLGDITLNESQGLNNLSAPSIFGSLTTLGFITGTVQTTGLRTDPITSAVSTVNADFGRVYVDTSSKTPVLTVTSVLPLGISGSLVSRGDLISQITVNNSNLTGLVAAQGNFGAQFTPTGKSTVRLGGLLVNGSLSGQFIVLGQDFADLRVNGGLLNGRMAIKGNVLGNVLLNGLNSTSAFVCDGSVGSTSLGTTFTLNGGNSGIIAAKGSMNFGKSAPGGNVFTNVTGTNAAAIDAIFTNGGSALAFDLSPLDLKGLALIQSDLLKLTVTKGNLTGTTP